MARIITVISGDGGIGKTTICLNLAISLGMNGYKTALFDADQGGENIMRLLDLSRQSTLREVIEKRGSIDDLVIQNIHGIDLIPGNVDIARMAALSRDQIHALIQAFSRLAPYDFILFDTSRNAPQSVTSFSMAAREQLIVLTPEPRSLTGAYGLLKILSENGYKGVPKVIVNQAKNRESAQKVYYRFAQTVQRHLALQTEHLGVVFEEPNAQKAAARHQPILSLYPESDFAASIQHITENIVRRSSVPESQTELDTFFTRYVRFLNQPIKALRKEENASPGHPVEKELPIEQNGEETQEIPEAAFPSSHPEMTAMVAKLIETMAAVSGELKALRMVAQGQKEDVKRHAPPFSIEKRVTPSKSQNAAPPGKPPWERIDFEAYRSAKKNGE